MNEWGPTGHDRYLAYAIEGISGVKLQNCGIILHDTPIGAEVMSASLDLVQTSAKKIKDLHIQIPHFFYPCWSKVWGWPVGRDFNLQERKYMFATVNQLCDLKCDTFSLSFLCDLVCLDSLRQFEWLVHRDHR